MTHQIDENGAHSGSERQAHGKDKPEHGKVYALTGKSDQPSIARGDSWKKSIVTKKRKEQDAKKEDVSVDPRMAIAAKRRAMELSKRKAIAARLAQSKQGKETQAAAVAGRQGIKKQQATKHSQKRWKEEAENIVDAVASQLTDDFDPRTHKVPRPAGMSKKQFDYKYKPTKVRKPKKDTGMKTPETQAALKYLKGKGPSPYGPGGKYEPKKEALDTWHPDPEKDKKSTSYKHHVKQVKAHQKNTEYDTARQKSKMKYMKKAEEHDCNESHPGMTHKEWVEDQKIEATYSERISSDVPEGNASGAAGTSKKKRKFRQVTPGQVRDYEKLSAARMFQAYEQKTDEDAPTTNTSGVANWDPLLGDKKTSVYLKKRRKVDGRTKDYKETVQRVQARRDALAARELEQKLNMFGVQSNPFKEETEMENNKKYLKTKEGSIEEAVLKSLMTETPVNPNDARPTLHLPEKKYLEIREGSLEEAVANVMTMPEDHVPGHSAKQVKMAKGIANDPRHKGGDMTGAWKKAEKIKKGLGDHPRVQAALRKANEEDENEDYSLAPKGKGSKAAKLLYGKRTGKNRVQPESAAGRGERDVGSQEYTDYVKNLTPGEGDSAVTDRDAQRSAKASQEANKEKKLRSTRIDDEYVVEKEVKVKDTRRVVDAIRAYDRSKDASRDATSDTDKGKKEKGDIEKKYAKKERGEIKKDDPNWKSRKYHTGMHGEETGAEAGHATALYKDQWKDRKRADWDKEHGREKMAKQDRADAEVDRKRMWGLTGDKWKHAKYASGEEEGKRTIVGNTPSPKDAYETFSGTPNTTHDPKMGQSIAKSPLKDKETVVKEPKAASTKSLQAKQRKTAPPGSTSENTELDEKDWIKGAIKKPGALRRQLDVPAGENIPAGKLKDASKAGGKLGQRARLAITLKKMHDEYEPETNDGLMEHDHHELGFETRSDMLEWAADVLEINEIGESELPLVDAVLKDLLAEIHTAKDTSHLDKAIADFKKKGGKVTQVKSKGLPKWAKAAHQKSEDVEVDEADIKSISIANAKKTAAKQPGALKHKIWPASASMKMPKEV